MLWKIFATKCFWLWWMCNRAVLPIRVWRMWFLLAGGWLCAPWNCVYMFPSVGEQVAIRIIVANHENKVRRQAIGMVLWAAVVKICPLYPKRVLLNLILLVKFSYVCHGVMQPIFEWLLLRRMLLQLYSLRQMLSAHCTQSLLSVKWLWGKYFRRNHTPSV